MLESLPSNIVTEEILSRLDFETLCTVACVNRTLKSYIQTQMFPSITILDLSSLGSVDGVTLSRLLARVKSGVRSLTVNCQRISDYSFNGFFGPRFLELSLCCCSLLSYDFLGLVGVNCPFLRVLELEMAYQGALELFHSNLVAMVVACEKLECLYLKIRGMEVYANPFKSIECFLPKTIKTLKLKPVLGEDAILLVNKLGVEGRFVIADDYNNPSPPLLSGFKLQCLSLVLDIISDKLLVAIANSLPFLVDLDLEDRPSNEPLSHLDLTDRGLQSLHSCSFLTNLSLVRSRKYYQGSFRLVNDVSMFLLAESCKDLQSLRLSGFSKVSDAGFAALLHSCKKLKTFEVRNALFLSDLAFHDLADTQCALAEVRLLSCGLITSEAVKKLAYSKRLEVLDLSGCKSVADSCLNPVSHLGRLTKLSLTGADITDAGLSILGQRRIPIVHLSLRGCKRVTDKGISFFLWGDGAIGQTLSVLDLGYIPGISDNGIHTIVSAGKRITKLCIRCCFYVTDSSLKELASATKIRQLDLYNCIGLTSDSQMLLRKPLFSGLRWVGIGRTQLTKNADANLSKIKEERPWLTVCLEGCEIGCQDGWQFHGPEHC